MTNDPDLEGAYALRSPEDAKRLYAAWAKRYDCDFGDGQGYLLPKNVVRAFMVTGAKGPILDVGAGTGLVGEGLICAGISPVDGLDLSPEMLDVARAKGVYRNLIVADVTRPLDLSGYHGIISAGTFTLGHVGPAGLVLLLDVADAGCQFVISVNAKHFHSAGFAEFLDTHTDQICDVGVEDVRIYSDKADLSHRDDIARLVTFRKT